MKTLPIADRLPKKYLEAIGGVIVLWARLEIELKHAAALLLGIDIKSARVAVRGNRASEVVEMIGELAHIKAIELNSIDLQKFSTYLAELKNLRDQIAHSLWLKGGRHMYVVQNIQGTWPRKDGKKIKKRIDPEGVHVTPTDLERLAMNIQSARRSTNLLIEEIAAKRPASRQTLLAQAASGSPPDQPNTTPAPQPTPSQK